MFARFESETIVKLPGKKPGEVEFIRWQRIYQLASQVFNDMCLKTEQEWNQIRSTDTFKKLNMIWGSCYFNTRQNIGAPTLIYREGECETVEEFYQYYFYSSKSPIQDTWKKGRNLGHLCQIGIDFYTYVCNEKGLYLDLTHFFECIWISIFYLTHLGVQREIQILNNLRKQYPFLEIIESDTTIDYGFGVDCEAWYEGILIMGFQIKSKRFLNQMVRCEELGRKFQPTDLRKQKSYQERFNVPVYTLIADEQAEIMCMLEIEEDGYALARTRREKRAIQREKRREADARLAAARQTQMRAYHTYDISELEKPAVLPYQPNTKKINTPTHFNNGFDTLKDLFA